MGKDADTRRARSVDELGENSQLRMLLTSAMTTKHVADAPAEVWHYTDAAGAAGIIAAKELWATDGLFMNDSSELQLVHRDFSTALKGYRPAAVSSDSEQQRLVSTFESALNSFQEDPGIFVVCFCESNDLLSQWRSYGRLGGGYALGFDSTALAGYDEAVVGELDFFKVIYSRDEQIDAVASFCSQALDELDRFLGGCEPNERDPAIAKSGETLALMAQWFSARVKDSAFREEQEWRFVCRNPTSPGKQAAYPREFRSSERGLVPYVRLRLGEIGKDTPPGSEFPLKRVRVGPTATTELSSRAMNYLLKDNGFPIQAERSVIPLRA